MDRRHVLEVVARCGQDLDVIVLPKAADAAMVRALDLVLAQAEQAAGCPVGAIGIEAQIETAGGVREVIGISTASPRLEAIALGPLDLAASLGMPADPVGGRRRLDPIASAMVVAARAAGIQVLDGPYVQIRDLDGLRKDARWAAVLGFDGRWVLHPDQVPVVDAVFSPSAEVLAGAERTLDLYRSATVDEGRGAVLADGEMIDEATARIARAVIERGRRARTEGAS